jgi:hypothetical protein
VAGLEAAHFHQALARWAALAGHVASVAAKWKRARLPDFLASSSIEVATITARGLAGQPVKCGAERAGFGKADIERNRRDGQLTICQ